MKRIWIFLLTTVLFLGSTQSVFASEYTTVERTKDPLVIVLDPGHDKTHGGARKNGLSETALNLKIAQYCYEELCTYDNVQVYMTRTTSECPHPETCGKNGGARLDNLKRVDFAKHLEADAYVALHLNSYESSTIKGAMVFVPNNNYRPEIGREGNALGQSILNKLVELGLKDEGVSIRASEDGTRYEDGSVADYYGVIKAAKDANISGIIVEHCFISSPEDVANHLSTEAQLKALGVADAAGIAKHYGLEKTGNTVAPEEIHKVEFKKDGKLVYTQYVRHGQSAGDFNKELIEAVNITYQSALTNITADTTIVVDYDSAELSDPKPDPEPGTTEGNGTNTGSEEPSETESEVNSETETEASSETEDVPGTETERETTTEAEPTNPSETEGNSEDTEIMDTPKGDKDSAARSGLYIALGLVIGLVIGLALGVFGGIRWNKKK